MEVFKYTRLATESGKDGLIALGICAVITAFIIFKFSTRPEGLFSKSGTLVLVVLGVFAVVAINSVTSRLKSKGAWEITINQKQLEWLSPIGIDNTFTVNLSDIQSFRTVLTDNDNYSEYSVVLHNGKEMMLSEESGLDFDDFATALKMRGVQIEQIETNSSE